MAMIAPDQGLGAVQSLLLLRGAAAATAAVPFRWGRFIQRLEPAVPPMFEAFKDAAAAELAAEAAAVEAARSTAVAAASAAWDSEEEETAQAEARRPPRRQRAAASATIRGGPSRRQARAAAAAAGAAASATVSDAAARKEQWLGLVQEAVASVLGTAVGLEDPLMAAGLDSLGSGGLGRSTWGGREARACKDVSRTRTPGGFGCRATLRCIAVIIGGSACLPRLPAPRPRSRAAQRPGEAGRPGAALHPGVRLPHRGRPGRLPGQQGRRRTAAGTLRRRRRLPGLGLRGGRQPGRQPGAVGERCGRRATGGGRQRGGGPHCGGCHPAGAAVRPEPAHPGGALGRGGAGGAAGRPGSAGELRLGLLAGPACPVAGGMRPVLVCPK